MGTMHSKAISSQFGARIFGSIWWLSVVVFVLALGLAAYAIHLRRSARALIDAAAKIQTTTDAEREIAIWRQRLPRDYSESRSADGRGRAFQFQMSNYLLSKFRLVPKTGTLLQVTTSSGQLSEVLLGMYTEKSSVWAQEEFSEKEPEQFNVSFQRDGSGKPIKTILMFTSNLAATKREGAFAFDANCLVRPGGCRSAEEILPTLPQLQNY